MNTKIQASLFYVAICIYCCYSSVLNAQSVQLNIQPIDVSSTFLKDSLALRIQFNSKLQCKQYIQQMPTLLQSKGYISMSIDSVIDTSNTATTITIFIGKKYRWQTVEINPIDKPLLIQLGVAKDIQSNTIINNITIEKIQEKLLNYFENNGQPFATVQFTNIIINENKINAALLINRGIGYKLDSIRVIGNAKINTTFLYKYLGMSIGSMYQADKLNQISQRIQELPYLQEAKPWNLSMLSTSFITNLYLQPKRNNELSALVGFLPTNTQTGGKLLFTGEATIRLNNAFATGETIGIHWQQLQPASPRLNLVFKKPYIFNSNLGIDFNFELYKRDSTFLNLTTKLGIQYFASAKQTATIGLQAFSTNVLTVDTSVVILAKKLPDIIDVATTNIVLDYNYTNTNYKFNPSKGFSTDFSLAVGNKLIKKNNTILQIKNPNFNAESLYDSLQLNTYQIRVRAALAYYFLLAKQSVFKVAATMGFIQSPSYFRNELYQIGGYKLLRGFDEESIVANKFLVATTEYRYLLSTNSYFNGFIDFGVTNNAITNVSNSYIGVGAGLAFEIKQGILNIVLAAGKQNDIPLNLRQSKIHIGFTSLF